MEKTNIAELLKDCPKGMELDCIMYDNVVLEFVVNVKEDTYPIKLKTKNGSFISVTEYGCYDMSTDAKCVIFPKGKTTWEGFVPPCQFEDGDIVFSGVSLISIFKGMKGGYSGRLHSYVSIGEDVGLNIDKDCWTLENIRLATEEEKAKLFQAIKDNGYRWNAETKTLEKLIEPKFKVGDRIKHKCEKFRDERTVISYGKSGYWTSTNDWIDYESQDDWELVPNKFDITTLTPFESKVLVRATDNQFWRPAIWGVKHRDWDFCCVLGGDMWEQCVPYEGNEHLLGTNNDCDEYYKTW